MNYAMALKNMQKEINNKSPKGIKMTTPFLKFVEQNIKPVVNSNNYTSSGFISPINGLLIYIDDGIDSNYQFVY